MKVLRVAQNGANCSIMVLVYNGLWKVVVTTPNLDYVWACVAIGGIKPSGKPYMGIVLSAIVLTLLGTWIVITRPVADTGVKTGSKDWVAIGECSPSLFTSSLEEEFLYDGVFYLAILDTIVPLLKIMHQYRTNFFPFLTLFFSGPTRRANLFIRFLVDKTNKLFAINLLHESQLGKRKRFLWRILKKSKVPNNKSWNRISNKVKCKWQE